MNFVECGLRTNSDSTMNSVIELIEDEKQWDCWLDKEYPKEGQVALLPL